MDYYTLLARWNRNDNIDRKVDLANIDNCGDRVCGLKQILIIQLSYSIKDDGEISSENLIKKLKIIMKILIHIIILFNHIKTIIIILFKLL